MRYKAILISILFLASLFVGSAMAAEGGLTKEQAPYDGAARGQRGVPQQQSQPDREARRPADQYQRQTGSYQTQQQFGMQKADALIGKEVVDSQGKEIGEIKNLLISESGVVEYVVISHGGDLYPVPWSAANLRPTSKDKVQASVTKQQLDNAPKISKNDWSQFNSPSYEQQVNSYYGTTFRAR